MHFVDDENLVTIANRRHAEAGDDDFADLIDLRVGGGVDFQHVDVAPLRDFDARVAHAARLRRRSLFAIQAARQDAGSRCLADTAGTGKHERLRDAPLAIALRSVWVTPRWPITSSKRCGRHLRARTWYDTEIAELIVDAECRLSMRSDR